MKTRLLCLIGVLGLLCISGEQAGNFVHAITFAREFYQLFTCTFSPPGCRAQEEDDLEDAPATVDADIGASRDALKTDDEVVERYCTLFIIMPPSN